MQTISETTSDATIRSIGTAGSDGVSISQVNLSQAISLLDAGLSQMLKRELVAAGEVTDLLLDVRSLLADVVPSPN